MPTVLYEAKIGVDTAYHIVAMINSIHYHVGFLDLMRHYDGNLKMQVGFETRGISSRNLKCNLN